MRSHYRFCKYCEELHQLGAWPHNCLEPAPQRSDFPSPYVVSDYLPGGVNGLFHHGVARKIDNKAGYRRATRESGCVEVGNEYVASKTRKFVGMTDTQIESAVNDAINEVAVDNGKGDDSISVTPDVNMGRGVFSHG